jgi:ParB family chromosome partitioning protein
MTRDEAVIAMVDANMQREVILPSEKAFSYKMKLEALKRQGQRTDLTSSPMEPKLRSDEKVAQDSGDSRAQIQRFIRLTSLIPALLQLVDEGKIAFRPAVELSYLQETEQTALLEAIEAEAATPSLAQAQKMKRFSQEGKLTPEVIQSVMQEEKPNQVEQFKMPMAKISRFFPPGTPAQKKEDTIVKALELYRQRTRDKGDR